MAVGEDFRLWPRIAGSKFRNHYNSEEYFELYGEACRLDHTEFAMKCEKALYNYASLSETCRQTYIDMIGSGLLYKIASFEFSNYPHLDQYLSVIKPSHKKSVTSLHLALELPIAGKCCGNLPERIPPRAINAVKACEGLRTITLDLTLHHVKVSSYPYVYKTSIQDETLEHIRERCEQLACLSNLRSFNLVLRTKKWEMYAIKNAEVDSEGPAADTRCIKLIAHLKELLEVEPSRVEQRLIQSQ
jgi:hypothetical protein